MEKDKNKFGTPSEEELRGFFALELKEIDGDIIEAATKARIGYTDPARIQRLQMTRDLRRIHTAFTESQEPINNIQSTPYFKLGHYQGF